MILRLDEFPGIDVMEITKWLKVFDREGKVQLCSADTRGSMGLRFECEEDAMMFKLCFADLCGSKE